MENLKGVILVTGANGGLGAGVVRFLLSKGYRNVACVYRSGSDQIANILDEYALPRECHLFRADLCDESSVAALREQVGQQLGPVYNLINLAGGSVNAISWRSTLDQVRHVMDINFVSTVLTCREFIPGMREEKYGRIVNASSVAAFRGAPGASAYTAAKAAIVGYSKSLALELAKSNITVNTLAIGYCETGLLEQVPDDVRSQIIQSTPVGSFGNADDIGHCINYLISTDSRFMTGQVHHINGGLY